MAALWRPGARPPLTPRQREVLDAIRAAIAATGIVPTVREIGVVVGLSSTCAVHKNLDALERKGYLRRPIRYGNRAIQLCDPDPAPAPAATAPRLDLDPVIVHLRIPVPDQPTSVFSVTSTGEVACPAGHPHTAATRWIIAGHELCRPCGRGHLADHLARKAGVR